LLFYGKGKEGEKDKAAKWTGIMMKSLIRICIQFVTPADTSIDESLPGMPCLGDESFKSRFRGVCKVIFWWIAAVLVGLFLAKLH
jgi:hypothetical protein